MVLHYLRLGLLAIWFFYLCNTRCAAEIESPDFVLVVSRHGVRAFKDQDHDASWSYKYEQLTNSGIRQQYLLGAALAAKYRGKALQNYSHSSIYLRALALTSTLQSINAQSLAFFPPGSGPTLKNDTPALDNLIQPSPVHSVKIDNDSLLYSSHRSVCPAQFSLQKKEPDFKSSEVLRMI